MTFIIDYQLFKNTNKTMEYLHIIVEIVDNPFFHIILAVLK
jgi:hypothetical protein